MDARLGALMAEHGPGALIATDLAGHVVIWSAAAESVFGHTSTEAVGQLRAVTTKLDNADEIKAIHNELSRHAGFTRLVQVIGDVINKKKLEGIFAMYRPQIVFHAGADKHVPLMEMNPDEAVFNNIVGTKNVLAIHTSVQCVSGVLDFAIERGGVRAKLVLVIIMLGHAPHPSNRPGMLIVGCGGAKVAASSPA